MIATLYANQLREDSDIVTHLPYFVELCVKVGAQTVIELGVRDAVSTVAWLHGLEQTGGQLWSVDIAGPPEWLTSDRWMFLRGDDLHPTIVDCLPNEVDIVFIDTSHHYEQTRSELETYLPKVRSGGFIVLHDTELEHPEGYGPDDPPFPVKQAIVEFCDARELDWTNNPECWGLATIAVR